MRIHLTKTWRVIRGIPSQAISDWLSVCLNKGELFGFSLAVFTSYIGLRTASLPQVLHEAEAWMDAIQAFIYVALGWLAICLLRAPWVIIHNDKRKGSWFGNRFVYHEPKLVATFRCKATGKVQRFPIKFKDAVPGAFVFYDIQVGDGNLPRKLYSATLVGTTMLGDELEPGVGTRKGGIMLRGMIADLQIVMMPETISQTVLVYCKDFSIGNPEDQDGETGTEFAPRHLS